VKRIEALGDHAAGQPLAEIAERAARQRRHRLEKRALDLHVQLEREIDGTADFGKDWETRAVRLRIVAQWGEQGGRPEGVRRDRGGQTLDPARCRIFGVAPLQYIGGEAPLDPLLAERLETYDAKEKKLLG
jgi:hypothetical protein